MEYLIPTEVGFDLGDSTTPFQEQSVLGGTTEVLRESFLGNSAENFSTAYNLPESNILIEEQENNLDEETDLLTGLNDSEALLNSELEENTIRIEAENYTNYLDTTAFNEGAPYRPDTGVDIQYTQDVGGGYNVGWIEQGESLSYEVVVPEAGKYWVNVRVAAAGEDNHVVSVNGQDIWFTATGDWQEWQTVTGVVPLKLEAGTNTIRLEAPVGTEDKYLFNINYFELVKNPFSDSPIEIKVEAEDFTDYVDLTPWNEGGVYRPAEGVDTQWTSDVGGGYNVGWIKQGEILEYTVNLPTAGEYSVDLRVAAAGEDNHALSINGQEVWITPTGGWQEWENVSTVVPLQLEAGVNTITLEAVTGEAGKNLFNLNYFELIPVDLGEANEVEEVEVLPLD